MMSLLQTYNTQIALGALRPDPAQTDALAALQALIEQLAVRRSAKVGRRLLGGLRQKPKEVAPRGLYLYGSVGRGKSMLMDLFFNHAPLIAKRRVHFHAFMQEIHQALFAARQETGKSGDPLPRIAKQIARQSRLLCFDEFYVTDIADAMVLARLFTALFAEGIVLVATSNTAPDDLYANGLQRGQFLPFISVLKNHVDVLHLNGAVDHRLEFLRGQQVYFTPLGTASTLRLNNLFAQMTEQTPPAPDQLTVNGREVVLQRVARGVLSSSFAELCEKPLGAADYLAIAQRYRAVILDGVPQFRADQRNETMRFITLIDALYEARVKLILAAQVAADELYPTGLHALMFHRTASRLNEMQGEAWLAQ